MQQYVATSFSAAAVRSGSTRRMVGRQYLAGALENTTCGRFIALTAAYVIGWSDQRNALLACVERPRAVPQAMSISAPTRRRGTSSHRLHRRKIACFTCFSIRPTLINRAGV